MISFLQGKVVLHPGDCFAVLDTLPEASVDSVVCDPPYHLTSIVKRFGAEGAAPAKVGQTGAFARASRGFMGKQWDGGDIAFNPELWVKVLRVLKPGGHVVAFSGTRTYHRMACAIEDAGFEIRDQLAWTYGSGFPKSHDVSKAITNRADPVKVREIKGWLSRQFEASGKTKAEINRACGFTASDYLKTQPGNDAAGRATWHMLLPYGEKWATLKAVVGFDDRYDVEIERYGIIASQRHNPKENREIYGKFSGVVTDYDLTDAAREWEGWGTALKPAWEPICLARKPLIGTVAENVLAHGTGAINVDGCRVPVTDDQYARNCSGDRGHDQNRSREMAFGMTAGRAAEGGRFPANLLHDGSAEVASLFPSNAGAAAPVRGTEASAVTDGIYGERGRVPGAFHADSGSAARFFYSAKADADDRLGSKHPTVKPVDLMRWLVRLVTPKGGTTLDPFAGTGTTGAAAYLEGCSAVLIEREAEYQADIARRMELMLSGPEEKARKLAKAETVDALPLFGGA